MKPRVCILKTDGTNCDRETFHGFQLAGAEPQIVLLNQLIAHKTMLNEFDILVLPGGFSYGDDVASGKILALELTLFLQEQMQKFIADQKLIIGICNGFQVLVRAGLLPHVGTAQKASLVSNDSGLFECRWVQLEVEKTNCVFTRTIEGPIVLPVAHAEGKFFAAQKTIDALEKEKLIPLRYANNTNPNGSIHNIAGICDSTGRIFGLMPHPERCVYEYQHPRFARKQTIPYGLQLFKNAVAYF